MVENRYQNNKGNGTNTNGNGYNKYRSSRLRNREPTPKPPEVLERLQAFLDDQGYAGVEPNPTNM